MAIRVLGGWTLCISSDEIETNAVALITFISFTPGPQLMRWCCLHLGLVILPQLIQFGHSLTGFPRNLSPGLF